MTPSAIDKALKNRIAQRVNGLASVRDFNFVQVSASEYSEKLREEMGVNSIINVSPGVEFWLLENDLQQPVAALQISESALEFAHGPHNQKVDRGLVDDYILPFLKSRNFDTSKGTDSHGYGAYVLGYIADIEGQWHHISELPDGLTIANKFDLWGHGLKQLPKNMTIMGTLKLSSDFPLEELPEGLTVDVLDLSDLATPITLPKGLNVKEEMLFDEELITEFPEDMIVRGALAQDTFGAHQRSHG